MTSLTLRHGHTLSDVHRFARLAVHLGPIWLSYADRYDLAWGAIVEHLYGGPGPIAGHDLVHVGRAAIWVALRSERQGRGYYRSHTDGSLHGPGSSPAFVTYWTDAGKSTGSVEGYVLDALALAQILPMLSAHERAALGALAAHDTYQDAAAALGVGYQTFKSQISRARRTFLALWHEGEEPSKPWGCDRRAGVTSDERRKGGDRAAISAVVRRKRLA